MPTEVNRRKQMLDADGLRIEYSETGVGDSLLVFPAEDGDFPDALLTKLAESHRVICLNLRSEDFSSAKQLAEKLPLALVRQGIERWSAIGISAGARPALGLAIAAPDRIQRLVLLSPLNVSGGDESLDLAAVKVATLVLVGTRDTVAAIEAGRRCREEISSCHLSFVYGVGHALAGDRPEACLDPITQFLEEGEQFIIYRESQVIRR